MATRLPSGKWRSTVYLGTVDGKRKYKSFTANTKKMADYKAKAYKLHIEFNSERGITLGEAMERYISARSNLLSPRTVGQYLSYKEHLFKDLQKKEIAKITQEDVQKAVNEYSVGRASKTVHNAHGFISAVFKEYEGIDLRTKLPQRVKPKAKIPTGEEITKLLKAVEGRKSELAIHLAVFMGLRRSEICGIKIKDVDLYGKKLSIKRAMVKDKDRQWVLKLPKAPEKERKDGISDLLIPLFIKAMNGKEEEDFLIDINPNVLTKEMRKACKRAEIQHYKLHELRYLYASMLLMSGIPDKYESNLSGHKTDYILTSAYQHFIDEKIKRSNRNSEDSG